MKLRVLVVDDNCDVVDSMIMLLEVLGHSANSSLSGAEAVQLVSVHRPHVVFLDIEMPFMDGWETAKRIRNLPGGENISLVAITGHGQSRHKRKSTEAGFDHHLVKPVDADEIELLLKAIANRTTSDTS